MQRSRSLIGTASFLLWIRLAPAADPQAPRPMPEPIPPNPVPRLAPDPPSFPRKPPTGKINTSIYISSSDLSAQVVSELLAFKKQREAELAKTWTNGFVLLRTRGRAFTSAVSDQSRIRFNADWRITRIGVDLTRRIVEIDMPSFQIGFDNSWTGRMYRRTSTLDLKKGEAVFLPGPRRGNDRFTIAIVVLDPDPAHVVLLVSAILEPSGDSPGRQPRRAETPGSEGRRPVPNSFP